MKALVTGATGLIGTALCKRLKGMGWDVVGLSSTDYLSSVVLIPSDVIFHLGCYSSPLKFMADPIRTIQSNTTWTLKLLEHQLSDKGTFLFASSSQIYGNATVFPTPESYAGCLSPLSPRAPYAESKRMGETLCSIYKDKVHVRIARISQVYGPGYSKGDGRVMSDFIGQALSNHEIRLRDKGEKLFKWLYVEDCVTKLLNIVLRGKNLVYNVAGHEKATIAQIARIVALLTHSQVHIPDSYDSMPDSPNRIDPDTTLYDTEFGKEQETDLCQGIKNTIEGYRTRL